MKHIDKLNKLDACGEAVRFAGKFKSGQSAWDNSVRGDWMLWLVGKTSGKPMSVKRKKLVLCACECARLALKYVPKGEDRPLKCIETAESWARGEATIEEVRVARRAAYVAAYVAASVAAYVAAYVASSVASSVVSSAYEAASYASSVVSSASARRDTLKDCADIVRNHYPKVPVVRVEK